MQLRPHPSQFLSLREIGLRVNGPIRQASAQTPLPPRHTSRLKSLHSALTPSVFGATLKRRYRINDLVAYSIPRFGSTAQSFSSVLRHIPRPPVQSSHFLRNQCLAPDFALPSDDILDGKATAVASCFIISTAHPHGGHRTH